MSVMSSHFERLNKIGGRALSSYTYTLIALAVTSSMAAALLAYSVYALGGGNQNALDVALLQVFAALFASLAASASVAIATLYAAKRLLAAYVTLVLHEIGAKPPETATELIPAARAQETVIAQQPSKPESVVQPAPAVLSTPRTVTEKKKCPYCGRPLPFGDVHVVCPYCGRRLK
jgi:hypothetical protein